MGKYSFVLSDELQVEYCKFKEGKDYDRAIIERLLHYYKEAILTNTNQLKRIGQTISKEKETALRKSSFTTQTLEELASRTTYKIILCTDRTVYPYVNIYDDKIENNLSGCFFKNESRLKATEHIKALCRNAKTIYIYDKYFSGDHADSNIEMLKSLLPTTELTLIYDPNHIEAKDCQSLQAYCPKWKLEKKILPAHHDRYLVIDENIEIILTSGFSYLSNQEKEFTYIIRPVSQKRF